MAGSRGNQFKLDPRLRRSAHTFGRAAATRDELPRLIVAVEGDTEEAYFDEIRRAERERIQVAYIPAERRGSHPLSVVQSAIAKKQEFKKTWRDGDRACAVFDGDEHKEGHEGQRERVAQALDLARANSIMLVITNPSIEFWFLKHYRYTTGAMHRDDALAEIKRLIPGYSKGMPVYRQHLRSRTPTAIEHAQRLRKHAETSGCAPFANPCTHMDEFLLILFGGTLPDIA